MNLDLIAKIQDKHDPKIVGPHGFNDMKAVIYN